jgi:hypothetical protein
MEYIQTRTVKKHKINDPPGKLITNIGGYIIYDKDVDIYDEDSHKLVAKFRKKKISNISNILKFNKNILPLAKRKKENRGSAAGLIERAKLRESVGDLYDTKSYRTGYFVKSTGKKSNTKICNIAKSNVLGYIDLAPRNTGRTEKVNLSAYARDYPQRYEDCLPFITDIDEAFKEVSADHHERQYKMVDHKYRMADTSFSTMTVNYSWQSALHKDANNGQECYSCITVIRDRDNKNNYSAGYLLFPEYRIGFNIREGDLLISDTVDNYHCNSPLIPTSEDVHGKWSEQDKINNWHLNRISVVCYIKKSCMKQLEF